MDDILDFHCHDRRTSANRSRGATDFSSEQALSETREMPISTNGDRISWTVMPMTKIMMDPRQSSRCCQLASSPNVTDVRSFLGFTNFYRRFIRNFSEVAKPLNALLQKDAKWEWTAIQFKAFEHLKTLLCSKPILVFPSMIEPFSLSQ